MILTHGQCGRGLTDFTVRHSDEQAQYSISHHPNPIKVSGSQLLSSWAKSEVKDVSQCRARDGIWNCFSLLSSSPDHLADVLM